MNHPHRHSYIVASVPRVRNVGDASDLHRVAFEIADETCRSDIEVLCEWVTVDGARWYDTRKVQDEEDDERVARAAAFLTRRSNDLGGWQFVRHPEFPALVRFEAVEA